MIEGGDPLAVALSDVAALGTDRDRERVAAIRDRLRWARLRVLVAGEAKRGKSTLVNAFLGQPVLPVGVTPLTAVATTVRYGDNPHAEVRFADGHEERHPYAALDDLVTERGNPANRRGIASVTVYVDAPVLADGAELVDTPGTGSVFAWDTEAAHDALETMDAAVFVLTGDPPVSAGEQDLLRRVAGLSVTTFVVLNKADYLDAAGLAEAVGFTQQVLGEVPGLADSAGASGAVYPMSARAALTPAGDPGFAVFAADFAAYLKASPAQRPAPVGGRAGPADRHLAPGRGGADAAGGPDAGRGRREAGGGVRRAAGRGRHTQPGRGGRGQRGVRAAAVCAQRRRGSGGASAAR